MDQQALAGYRYRAVTEVLGGSRIGEVAATPVRDAGAVGEQLEARRFRAEGMPGLVDRSHRAHHSPARIAAEVEVLVCELRRRN